MSDKPGTMRGVSDMPGISDTGVVSNMPGMNDMSRLNYDHGHCDVGAVLPEYFEWHSSCQ
jgi:hypothetical protein